MAAAASAMCPKPRITEAFRTTDAWKAFDADTQTLLATKLATIVHVPCVFSADDVARQRFECSPDGEWLLHTSEEGMAMMGNARLMVSSYLYYWPAVGVDLNTGDGVAEADRPRPPSPRLPPRSNHDASPSPTPHERRHTAMDGLPLPFRPVRSWWGCVEAMNGVGDENDGVGYGVTFRSVAADRSRYWARQSAPLFPEWMKRGFAKNYGDVRIARYPDVGMYYPNAEHERIAAATVPPASVAVTLCYPLTDGANGNGKGRPPGRSDSHATRGTEQKRTAVPYNSTNYHTAEEDWEVPLSLPTPVLRFVHRILQSVAFPAVNAPASASIPSPSVSSSTASAASTAVPAGAVSTSSSTSSLMPGHPRMDIDMTLPAASTMARGVLHAGWYAASDAEETAARAFPASFIAIVLEYLSCGVASSPSPPPRQMLPTVLLPLLPTLSGEPAAPPAPVPTVSRAAERRARAAANAAAVASDDEADDMSLFD